MNVTDLGAYRKISSLRAKITKVQEQINHLHIIWNELTPDEKLDPTTQRQVQETLLKARLTIFRAENAIKILKEKQPEAVQCGMPVAAGGPIQIVKN